MPGLHFFKSGGKSKTGVYRDMSAISSIKNRIKQAAPSELSSLLSEAQSLLAANPSLDNYFRIHIFKEYNKRAFKVGATMLTPYDGGFRPSGDVSGSPSSNLLLIEDGTSLLLFDGTEFLLE